MYPQQFMSTGRLKIAYYRAGEENASKLLLLHGNLSSSVFFLPLFPILSKYFDIAAPDFRCFGDTESLAIDATRGYRDWSDDLDAFLDGLGWDCFAIAGWSMGGNVAMQYAIDHPKRITKLIFIAPGSPFGFGGTKDETGTPLYPPGLASGGGCANPQVIMAVSSSRLLLRQTLNAFYFHPPFRMNREWEDRLLESISKTKIGKDKYPGNYSFSYKWPFVTAGDKGVLNAMSPQYGNLTRITQIKPKPPILWIRGSHDVIVSDNSMFEFGYLGKSGMVPGWPGDLFLPPQPMVTQTRYVLNQYKENGGTFNELVLPGGHACFLESPQMFVPAVRSFLSD